jgi:transmembrane sensor
MTDRPNRDFSNADARRATEQAASWYLDQREGLSATDQEAFLIWLKQSPVHVGEYLAIARLHGDLKAAAAMETMSAEQLRTLAASEPAVVALHGEREALFVPTARRQRNEAPRRGRSRLWLAAASVAVIGLFAAGALLFTPDHPRSDVYASTITEGRSLNLPDGSLVQLDRDSAIAVNFDAQFRRIELLHGSALFDVGKDPGRPLQVQIGASMLRDIGTVFAVRRDNAGDEVTVVSGRVNVLSPTHPWLDVLTRRLGRPSTPDNVVADLGAGEQVIIGADGAVTASSKHADIAQATVWLPSIIQFHNTTVGEVARRFNAYTTTPLAIDDPQIAAKRINGLFHAHDVDAFVAYLGSLPGVQIQRGNDRVQVIAATAGSKPAHHRL